MKSQIILILLFSMLLMLPSVKADYIDVYPFSDSYVNSAFSTTNYGTLGYGEVYSGGNTERLLYNFSNATLFSINSTYVTAVTFNLYSDDISGIVIQDINGAWTELGVTFSNEPAYGSAIIDGFTTSLGWNYNINIINEYRSWANGSNPNFGFGIFPIYASEYGKYQTREGANPPYIRITYNIPINASNYSLSGYIKDLSTNQGIQGVKVRILNNYSTYSEEAITNSVGFYTASNLSQKFNATIPTTFYVQASKIEEYEDSALEPVTVTSSAPTLKNITMQKCVSGFTCFYNKEYVTFKAAYQNGTVADGAVINIYYNSSLEITVTTDSYGYARVLLFKSRYYYITTTHGIASNSFYITPTLSSYPIVLNSPILGYMNGMASIITATNSSIWFNMTDPNSEVTSLNITYGNTTNTSIYAVTNLSGTTVNNKFTPQNLTSEYKVSWEYTTVHYGKLSGSMQMVLKYVRTSRFDNLPSWLKNGAVMIISFILVFISARWGFVGAGVFFAAVFTLIMAGISMLSSDITSTNQFIVGVPVLGFFGFLWQIANKGSG